ncbi:MULTISPECIES: CHASE2 domain-containing protein [unclassified Bradyrhizobium]|uniref:CHASE2 domain-containing protein n=1 Tax=unclassified Bradyrhizobium TaxID=2631580 RepID=UPI001BA69477|nr:MULTISPECIES: adenylate/guanylate cyclase domain-containing protein [unclassified Bradyrhizobium]MBR1204797.1 adenylate/guanylate cyclase domain-containing protein [Bradyrhizobium sp. AUGA SZCCT0124]MBR1311883.1 adenylate/guanylate cyclase domain-containing protein [Bradyrhizobium sp. AUGA SZCCT0051]MBR1343613.1 adenylate/guanylate cyclase domain-containing protein [Bradyrhizobium sp. AUGA SZCCT0105]MBR1358154.1 adenylate/guanylate cyclase domain-containing protein [Bradyrhizobium sp. AUGA S
MRRLKAIRRWFGRRFGYARLACVALLIGIAALRIADPAPIQELRVRTFDTFQVIEPRQKTARPVTIVDIDEKSLADPRLGQWPWPRTRLADIVINLTRLGAVVIAFDAVFSEPDRLNPDIAADTFSSLDEEMRARLRQLPSNDSILADAIKNSRVVLGESGGPNVRADLNEKLPVTGLAMLGEEPQSFMFQFPGLLRNVPVLEEAAAGRGLFTIRPERDGIVRRVPMMMVAQGITMPSLTFEMLRVAGGSGTILIKADKAGIKSLGIKGFAIPTDLYGQLWIHYARRDPSIYVSAVDVLDGRVPPDRIAGKLILIGTSSVGLNDIKTTPVTPAMPGVEVHAQVLESALTGDVVSQPNYGIGIEFFAALIMGLLVIAFAPKFGPITLVVVGGMFASVLTGTSWYFYSQHRLLIDFTYPLMSTTAIYLTLIFSAFVREQQQRRQIRSQFVQYMSPALVEQLAQSPERLVLGGEEREMTIMFSDMRGFTSISETYKRDPQGLTALMNRFLTPLTNAILARKGYIDKYMGDAIMAFWNAPLDDKQHQLNACDAALDMLEHVGDLNRKREQEAQDGGHVYVPLNIGVGLNTGTCVVGNMGSDLKFNYSVLGDSVNLAARLEGQSKEYGFPIIVGSKTALAVKEKFAILELDFIMVKGKKEPEVIYAIAGREDVAGSGRFQRLRNLTIEMLACYRGRDWDGALAAIERGRKTDEAQTLQYLYRLYEARIRAFQNEPPPDDWDGAFALTTK